MLTLASLEAFSELSRAPLYMLSNGITDASIMELVERTCALVRARGILDMQLIDLQVNMYQSFSIIYGETQICDDAGTAIVIEDDLVLSPAILISLKRALNSIVKDTRIVHVLRRRRVAKDACMFSPLTIFCRWATRCLWTFSRRRDRCIP